jgi:hypothetical protein
MKVTTRALLTAALLLVFISPVLADAPATAAEKEQAQAFFVFITLTPVSLLLLALPVAVLFRASTRVPERVAETLTAKPGLSLFLGAANLLLMAILGWAGNMVPLVGILAFLFLVALAIVIFIGLTSVATMIGRRLYGGDPRGNSVGAFTLGWLVLAGLTLLPLVGFLLHLWFAAKGVGAVVLSFAPKPD